MPVPLLTQRLILRPLVLADAEGLFAYRRESSVATMQGWAPASAADAATFIEALAGVPFGCRGAWSQLAVVEADGAALVGDVAARVDPLGLRAEIGFTIAPAHQRRGYAAEAVGAMMQELVAVVGIRRFTARALAVNAASIALLTRLGFIRYGGERDEVWFEKRCGGSQAAG